jgi:P4 family phage/plasmid primase-like protien
MDEIQLVKPVSIKKKMNTNTSKNSKAKFFDFMKNHVISKDSDKKSTNTRIGDKSMNIYGGNYHISEEEYQTFLDLYFQEVFIKKNPEYLTEVQLEKSGPILIDIDLRFSLDVGERIYSNEHIDDLIDQYLEELKTMYQFDEDSKFCIYLFEKSGVKKVPEKNITKDGIHLIIGIQSDHITQQILRKKMVNRLEEIWNDFPITNTWEDVLDPGISTGKTNWQMYGSTKPGYEPYSLTRIFEISYDPTDEEFMRKIISVDKFNMQKDLFKLSARCNTHPALFYKNTFINVREEAIQSGEVVCDSQNIQKKIKKTTSNMNFSAGNMNVLQIKNRDELNECVNQFLDNIVSSSLDYELREAYDYTMTLPDIYYGQGSFLKWIRVGWALRNISDRLFIVWVAFSAKSPTFDFRDIPELYEKWLKFDMNNPQGLTKRSIMHWSKIDAFQEYKKVRENSIDYYIDQTLYVTKGDLSDEKRLNKGCGDFDLAVVLFHLFKDEFVCVSVKANIWFTYKKHRWVEIDSGTTLRKAISVELRDMYRRKASIIAERAVAEKGEEKEKIYKLQLEKILDICLRLSRTNDKKNIMVEAKELFFDDSFLQKLDTNPYLLCFNNGVFDFKEKVFRRGYPEDYISKTTNIDYKQVNRVRDAKTISEITEFMHKLFPVKQLHDYMWEHLASTLIGTSVNQTFNMYIGIGSNGKSVLISLMEKILGEYKGDVPLSLVTDRRTKIGGLAPEMVALKGIRYAVMQEPKKGDTINEGVMKQITSGIDPIQARAPYMPQAITFIPQFKLVVCANVFMEIKSQDNGTWRRIRVVDFLSVFTDKPVKDDPDKPYQFLKQEDLTEKFDDWKEIFAALLVEKAVETNGIVKDCEIVLKSSNSYRESQDYIAEFISDRVIIDVNGTITKTELTTEFNIWYQGAYGTKGSPSPKDVQSYMDKRFGKFEKYKCWKGVRINYDRDIGPELNVSNSDDEDSDDIDVDDL